MLLLLWLGSHMIKFGLSMSKQSQTVGIAGTQFLLLHDSLRSFAATAATHTPLLQQRQHTLLCRNSGNTHSFAATRGNTHSFVATAATHTLLIHLWEAQHKGMG